MKELYSEIEIDAPAWKVWEILTDFESYPHWNPFIRRIKGKPEAGARLEAFIEPSGTKGMTFRPVVLVAEPERELRWLGRLFLPRLFDGEHVFQIEPIDEERSRFIQREIFRGILLLFLKRILDRDTQRGFEEMNIALKRRAEQAAGKRST